MKILISGGTGLVGSEIGKALVNKGHQIVVLTRSPEKSLKNTPYPHQAVSWEELEANDDLADLDGVINLAGTNLFEKRWNKKVKQQIHESRVDGTKKLVDLANSKWTQLQFLISTSAVGIYGEADDQNVGEDYSKSYGFLGKVCQDWEAPLENLAKARGVIFRVGIVLSEKGGALEQMVPPIQAGFGGPLGSGKQFMSWIDIDDLVNMYVFAVDNEITGVFNAVAPNPETNKKITQSIAGHLGVSAPFPVPYAALRMVVGEVAPHLVESQTISSEKIQNKGFQFQFKKVEESIKVRVAPLKGHQKRYLFEQWVPKGQEEVFSFFCDAHNLEQITPPSLNFKIVSVSTDPVEQGTEIRYKLKIDGIPVNWKTLIKDWNPPHMFSDNQEKGPYKKWYHIHKFETLGEGTLMTDQVDFEIPLRTLGYLAAGWKVLKDVRKIFDYRREQIYKMYF